MQLEDMQKEMVNAQIANDNRVAQPIQAEAQVQQQISDSYAKLQKLEADQQMMLNQQKLDLYQKEKNEIISNR